MNILLQSNKQSDFDQHFRTEITPIKQEDVMSTYRGGFDPVPTSPKAQWKMEEPVRQVIPL